jgi:hypothetical protein
VLRRAGTDAKENSMRQVRLVLTTSLLVLGISAAPAAAHHDHGIKLGNGDCVALAWPGGEKHVSLPDTAIVSNPNAQDQWAGHEGRNHPLHVFVHMGRPGQQREIGVIGGGDDPCGEAGAYRNRR